MKHQSLVSHRHHKQRCTGRQPERLQALLHVRLAILFARKRVDEVEAQVWHLFKAFHKVGHHAKWCG